MASRCKTISVQVWCLMLGAQYNTSGSTCPVVYATDILGLTEAHFSGGRWILLLQIYVSLSPSCYSFVTQFLNKDVEELR